MTEIRPEVTHCVGKKVSQQKQTGTDGLETSLQRKPWLPTTWTVKTHINKYALNIQTQYYTFALIWSSGEFSSFTTIECMGMEFW